MHWDAQPSTYIDLKTCWQICEWRPEPFSTPLLHLPTTMSEITFPPTDTPGFHVNPGSVLPKRSRVQTFPASGHGPSDSSLSHSRASVSSEWGVWDSDLSASMTSSVGPSASIYSSGSTTGNRTPVPSQSVVRHDGPPKSVTTKMPSPPQRVRPEEVWRDMIGSANGRDKAFSNNLEQKLIQYSLKLYLLFHARTFARLKRGSGQLEPRLRSTVAGFSLVRKCLILFNWLGPLLQIINPASVPFSESDPLASRSSGKSRPLLHRFLHASPPVLLELFNSLADDVYTFSRLGLVGKKVGGRAEKAANWLWLLSTLAGLVEVGADRSLVKNMIAEHESRVYKDQMELNPKHVHDSTLAALEQDEDDLETLKSRYKWLQVSRMKLLCDLVFVSYDVFHFQKVREPAMALSGFASAILSSSKIYDKHYNALAKSDSN
ncbi:peroxisomal biogenesis factor 11 [Rhizoctonia solani]|uniref:Peroxisomal biogenesis factor 11 n=1 Tax=Rhizoctonia solani TaxID=456999 RepID=A0A8H8NVF6_9AGAM|nr:peroxisomal biogenesis factor 11 [Rhizoctonia solani]QRW19578.1 peroxisomal biogenesis factor 11 [Rhizoctonia solani]